MPPKRSGSKVDEAKSKRQKNEENENIFTLLPAAFVIPNSNASVSLLVERHRLLERAKLEIQRQLSYQFETHPDTAFRELFDEPSLSAFIYARSPSRFLREFKRLFPDIKNFGDLNISTNCGASPLSDGKGPILLLNYGANETYCFSRGYGVDGEYVVEWRIHRKPVDVQLPVMPASDMRTKANRFIREFPITVDRDVSHNYGNAML